MHREKMARRELIGPASAAAAVASTLTAAACSQQDTRDLDLVILNCRVMDPEPGFDAVANVGVKAGRITAITEDAITGRETIDATGLVVAPGFIDAPFHYPRPVSTFFCPALLSSATESTKNLYFPGRSHRLRSSWRRIGQIEDWRVSCWTCGRPASAASRSTKVHSKVHSFS